MIRDSSGLADTCEDLCLGKRGMNCVSVSTRVSNTPAIHLYESVGFRIVNRYIGYVREGEQSA